MALAMGGCTLPAGNWTGTAVVRPDAAGRPTTTLSVAYEPPESGLEWLQRVAGWAVCVGVGVVGVTAWVAWVRGWWRKGEEKKEVTEEQGSG